MCLFLVQLPHWLDSLYLLLSKLKYGQKHGRVRCVFGVPCDNDNGRHSVQIFFLVQDFTHSCPCRINETIYSLWVIPLCPHLFHSQLNAHFCRRRPQVLVRKCPVLPQGPPFKPQPLNHWATSGSIPIVTGMQTFQGESSVYGHSIAKSWSNLAGEGWWDILRQQSHMKEHTWIFQGWLVVCVCRCDKKQAHQNDWLLKLFLPVAN